MNYFNNNLEHETEQPALEPQTPEEIQIEDAPDTDEEKEPSTEPAGV